jgi:hypothetical protein
MQEKSAGSKSKRQPSALRKPLPLVLIVAVVFLLFWNLTKIVNQSRPDPLPGASFWLNAQSVVQCTPEEITLVDKNLSQTHLEKDGDLPAGSWPDCSSFNKDELLDFHLSRGEKTKFLQVKKHSWL